MTITINVTKMFSHREPWDCSNNAFNLGPNVAKLTWACATEVARNYRDWLLSDLQDALDEIRHDAEETGAWNEDELDSWTQADFLAYLVQTIAADLRMLGSDDNELADCYYKYVNTDWSNKPEYPKAHYYMQGEEVMADFYGGM